MRLESLLLIPGWRDDSRAAVAETVYADAVDLIIVSGDALTVGGDLRLVLSLKN